MTETNLQAWPTPDPFGATLNLAPAILTFNNLVVASGGTQLSPRTLKALSVFWRGLVTDHLAANDGSSTKIRALNVYVPDSLIACATPLIQGLGGLAPWTNHNFVAGDLTVNGLAGDGTSKYFNTGIVPNAAILNTNSAGVITCYSTDNTTGNQCDLGCYGAQLNSFFGVYSHYASTPDFGCWRFDLPGSGSLTWTAPTDARGFYSCQRSASNALRVDFANNGQAYSTLASGVGIAGTIETVQPLYAHAANSSGTAADFSRKRYCLNAITSGLSLAESQAFYARFVTFRNSLGGGIV